MNRHIARKIAETITNEQLQQMFETAKSKITNWTQVSNVNKGITKGVAWNVLAKDFDVNKTHHILAKINMIREFGKSHINKPTHQNPIFLLCIMFSFQLTVL